MPFFGKKTLADCTRLHDALHPRVQSVQNAYAQLRQPWQERDIFSAERTAKDVRGLETRWANAETELRTLVERAPHAHPGLTPAQSTYDRMVRAVRQGGWTAPERPGDLAELHRRVRKAARKLGGARHAAVRGEASFGGEFGDDLFNNKTYADLVQLTHNYDGWIAQLRQRYNTIAAAWTAANPGASAAFAADLGGLEARWAAVHNEAAGTVNSAANYVGLGNDYFYWKYLAAICQKCTAGNQAAQQTPGDYQDLFARLSAAERSLGVTPPPAYPAAPPAPDSGLDFLKATDPKKPGILGALANAGKRITDDPNPFNNPWVQGAIVIVGIGVVGYTLSQFRAFVPSGANK
jgi:hypothetical protein